MDETRIFLADDHSILREGLHLILSNYTGFKIVGESGDGLEALQLIEKIIPDVAIIDISMPSMTGIEISRQLKKYHPEIKVIILSRHCNEEYIYELLKYKIDGYILKENASDELYKAIVEVMEGNPYFSSKVVKAIIRSYSSNDVGNDGNKFNKKHSILSSREMEILKLIAEGLSSKEVSSCLFISEHTVKTHRANIMKKLDIHKYDGLIKYSIKIGLIEP